MEAKKVTIHINQRVFHFDKTVLAPQEFRDAIGAPANHEVWKIVKSPDPEGQLPLDDEQVTAPVEIKSGEKYRVVPPGTFGAPVLPQSLIEEVEALRTEGFVIDLVAAEGWANIVFQKYPVPPGYSQPTTTLLLKLPMSYPNGRPDMFWTDVELTLPGGRAPSNADVIESALGKRWRRFSWHPQSWNPAVDDLRTYLEFVNARLAKAV